MRHFIQCKDSVKLKDVLSIIGHKVHVHRVIRKSHVIVCGVIGPDLLELIQAIDGVEVLIDPTYKVESEPVFVDEFMAKYLNY
jgi:hypothetical protein